MSIPSTALGLSPRRWLLVACVGLATSSTAMDASVNVALPTITQAFQTNLPGIQWIIIGYITTTVALSVGIGSAADLFGLRHFFLFGLVSYGVVLTILGLSPNLPTLVGLRVLQAVGTAAIVSTGPALIAASFTAEQRGRALGTVTGATLAGTVIGSFGAGLILDTLGWTAIFWGRVPIVLTAMLLALFVLQLPPLPHPGPVPSPQRQPFDFPGALSMFAGLVTLVLSFSLARGFGWSSAIVVGLLTSSVMAGFFSTAFATSFLSQLGVFVLFFVFPFFVADVLKQPATVLGLFIGTLGLCAAAGAPLSGWICDRFRPQWPISLGALCMALILLAMSRLSYESSIVTVVLLMGLVGLGSGMFQASTLTLVLTTVPGPRYGTASGAIGLGRSLGVVVSVALFSAFVSQREQTHILRFGTSGLSQEAARTTAFLAAYQDAFVLGALLVGAAVICSLLAWPRPGRQHRDAL